VFNTRQQRLDECVLEYPAESGENVDILILERSTEWNCRSDDIGRMACEERDPQGGDYTDIVSKYTNDWQGKESTKRMEE
jgi:hypothetical protein